MTLTARQLLTVWDGAQAADPVNCALTILAIATGEDREALAALPIGRRDALLLDVRRRTFGDTISAQARCDGCGAMLEWTVSAGALLASSITGAACSIRIGGRAIEVRPLTSDDLLALQPMSDPVSLRRALAQRAIVGDAGWASKLGPDFVAEVEQVLAVLDPAADIVIDCVCDECGTVSALVLDAVAWLWTDIRRRAMALLTEVRDLALAFGWSEADILAMPPARRAAYLQLLA